jgi:hypothetical protein
MPGGDRTGPMGLGPMTGRGMGRCAGFSVPGTFNPTPGRGYWGWGCSFRGRGGGRGFRHWYYATGLPRWARSGLGFGPYASYGISFAPPMTGEQEMEILRQQADYFNSALEDIKKRIDELGAKQKDE